MEITDIITAAVSEAQLLALAASVAETAGHPLREVLKNAAAGLNLPACSGVVTLRSGIAAQCSRKNIRMGTLAFVRTVADVPAAFAKYEAELQKQGKTAYYLTCGRNLQGIIAVGEKVNTNLAPALQSLQKLGVRTVMFSSGAKHRAEYIGRACKNSACARLCSAAAPSTGQNTSAVRPVLIKPLRNLLRNTRKNLLKPFAEPGNLLP